jgi:hypothetical protein
MKVLESPLIGTKAITAREKGARLFQVKQALVQHRDRLIARLMNDIPYYLAFKHKAYATVPELQEMKAKLAELQKKDINLLNYAQIVEMVAHRSKVRINNELFFQEIDNLLLGK